MRTFNEVKTLQREKPLKPPEQGLLWRAALRGRSLHKAKGSCTPGSRAWLAPWTCPWRTCPSRAAFTGDLLPRELTTCVLKMFVLLQRAARFTFPLPSAWECYLTINPISGAFWGVSTVTICSLAHTPPSWSLPCELTSLRGTGTEITLLCSSLTIFILLWTSVMIFMHMYGLQRELWTAEYSYEKLFADLWEFIQNCFFPSSAAKNLKPLGYPAMSLCFSYWSAVL